MEFQITRPIGEAWDDPDATFPLVIFQHGQQQEGDLYEEFLLSIARRGAVVVSVLDDTQTSATTRAFNLTCLAEYFAETWAQSDKLSCDLFLGGHSNGGKAAHWASQWLLQEGASADAGRFQLAGLFQIAPLFLVDGETPFEGFEGSPPSMVDPDAPALLTIDGSNDEDPAGGSLANFEAINPEAQAVTPARPKVALWAYDVTHKAWGGVDPVFVEFGRAESPAVARAKATALLRNYVPEFIFSQLGPSPELTPILTLSEFPPSIEGEPTITEPTWWNYLVDNETGVPMVFGSHVPSLSSSRSRRQVDTMDRVAGDPGDPPLISSAGFPIAVTSGAIEFGTANQLATFGKAGPGGQTVAARLDWNGQAEVVWDVSTADLSQSSSLRIRVANLVGIPLCQQSCRLNRAA